MNNDGHDFLIVNEATLHLIITLKMSNLMCWLGLRWQLLLLIIGCVAAQQAHFEDADKSSDYTDQQFDLRHTIPGTPGVDYPILSVVPQTSFVCNQRHEGYYADVESRCQAFRICAHTARSPQGFGFLCPNGTIFSQQKFVCDWYRNVNCDESERYYDMNRDNVVGDMQQMMERVRQMMEYPTQTISKALQQSTQTHHTLSKDLSSLSGVLAQPATVPALRGEDIKSEALPAAASGSGSAAADVYVNSLGELSSDPGIQFDHTNAHIIAEYPREYHFQKQKNFAARVNAGLEQLVEGSASSEQMTPDYIKQLRTTKDEALQLDLVANINNLLEEASTDVEPSVSGYQTSAPQKLKQPFRFLSRGFAMQPTNNDKSSVRSSVSSSSNYLYNRPKQTSGIVRLTPNEIPIDAHKDTEHKHKFISDKTTTTTTTTTTTKTPALLIVPTLPPAFAADTTTKQPTTYAFKAQSNYETHSALSQSLAAALTASAGLAEQAEPAKHDVEQEAQKLLLAGVKLTSLAEQAAVPSSTTTVRPRTTASLSSSTSAMSTSTETVTEISSTQERIRSYRRFSQKRVSNNLRRQGPQRGSSTTARPVTIRSRSTTTTITAPSSTTPTRSYADRLAASRLRLSRLSSSTAKTTAATATTTRAAATTSSTAATALEPLIAGVEQSPNKKLIVRDIEKETSQRRGSFESVQNNLQRFQLQRGNRVYTPATRASSSRSSSTTTSSGPTTVRTTVQRGRNRQVSYRTQAPLQRTRAPTTPRSSGSSSTTTTTAPRTRATATTSAALSTLSQQISAIASGYNYTPAPPLNTLTLNHNASPTSTQSTSSLSTSNAFLPFDKLTRAIHYQKQQQQPQRQQQHVVKPNSFNFAKPTAAAVTTAPAAVGLTLPQRTQQQPIVLPTIPGIVIARAEGQRIEPNAAGNIIQNLVNKPQTKSTPASSYVALSDFLTTKFGSTDAASPSTLQQQQQSFNQQHQHQQQHQQQPQMQHQPISYQNQYQQQPYRQQQQQQFNQQQQPAAMPANQQTSIQANQQPYLTPNVFLPYKQQQQHLPLFPPLAIGAAATTLGHMNVNLPTLGNGLLPSPTLQVAQRRSDINVNELPLSNIGKATASGSEQARENAFYAGRTSYQVPQSSIGRLPNDSISQLMRQRRYRY
ncbi:platelet binding protein GspB [Drosophila busckii]|nr:platelet binding protein GspB [Drosophila busckii]